MLSITCEKNVQCCIKFHTVCFCILMTHSNDDFKTLPFSPMAGITSDILGRPIELFVAVAGSNSWS